MKTFTTALIITMATCSIAGCLTEYHVSTTGLDVNPGSQIKPFKTISAAAAMAKPGDMITVHEGIYREEIAPPRGGTSEKKRIIYQAAHGENVEIRGSEAVTNCPFETPDGKPFVIDTDYFDKKRDMNNPSPGPFENLGTGRVKLKVWPLY